MRAITAAMIMLAAGLLPVQAEQSETTSAAGRLVGQAWVTGRSFANYLRHCHCG